MGETPWRFKSSQPHHVADRYAIGVSCEASTREAILERREGMAFHSARAAVAELVDAQVSGTCDRKVVEVRVFSAAPFHRRLHAFLDA